MRALLIITLLFSLPCLSDLIAKVPARAETVMPVVLKSFDKSDPKKLTIEYENKSGKDITRIMGGLSFMDKTGKSLFVTGVTTDLKNWAAGSKMEDKPFVWFDVPPDLIKALDQNPKSVIIKFTASQLNFADGTEEKFDPAGSNPSTKKKSKP